MEVWPASEGNYHGCIIDSVVNLHLKLGGGNGFEKGSSGASTSGAGSGSCDSEARFGQVTWWLLKKRFQGRLLLTFVTETLPERHGIKKLFTT